MGAWSFVAPRFENLVGHKVRDRIQTDRVNQCYSNVMELVVMCFNKASIRF